MKLFIGSSVDLVYNDPEFVVNALNNDKVYVVNDIGKKLVKVPMNKITEVYIRTSDGTLILNKLNEDVLSKCKFSLSVRRFKSIDLNDSINKFIDVGKKVGKENLTWNFTKINLNNEYSVIKFSKLFKYILYKLHDYVGKIIISFVNDNFNDPVYRDLLDKFIGQITSKCNELGINNISFIGKNLPTDLTKESTIKPINSLLTESSDLDEDSYITLCGNLDNLEPGVTEFKYAFGYKDIPNGYELVELN